MLGLVVAELLFRSYPRESEGALAKRLAALVDRHTLAGVAVQIGLGDHLVMSKGEDESGARASPGLLADACEAVIGALYLDGGLSAAEPFIQRLWAPLVEAPARPPQDAKTALQEWAQGAGLRLPSYVTKGREGPPHDPVFAIEVSVDGHPPATGTGKSKRVAEQAAAAALLERMRADG